MVNVLSHATQTCPGCGGSATYASPASPAAKKIAVPSNSHPTALSGCRSAIRVPAPAKAANPSAPTASTSAPSKAASQTAAPASAT